MAQLTIQRVLQTHTELEFAVLVGSRANGRAQPENDWDIAIQWKREISMLDNLANTETLRRNLAAALGVAEDLT